VTLSDTNCSSGGVPVKRTLSTNAAGQLPDPGVPVSTYDVCVDDGSKHVTATVDLETFTGVGDFNDGTTLDVYLGGGVTGVCP
jgi:hypothetical protein